LRRLAAAAFAALAGAVSAHGVTAPPPAAFEPPAAGTYRLPPIQAAPDGEVLDAGGRARPLADFTHGRITLLGLVYTRCTDADGCPRATWAFGALRTLLRDRPELEARVRLVTLSFDPAHDTPARLAAYAKRVGAGRPGAEWRFLTTRSRAALDPILEGLGQDLQVEAGSRARPGTEDFTHTLKVFLIDPAGRVREIYGTAFLMPAMLLNDMQTLYSYADSGGQEQTRLRSP
jgi:cytochrome oxidase Cu insertion factor (SCO1/SenC/PrrC family)